MKQNKLFIIALIILSIPFLACAPGGGGAPAGGGGAPGGGGGAPSPGGNAGQGGINIDIDTEQIGQVADSAAGGESLATEVDMEQLSQITDAASEIGSGDVDTEQIGTAVDSATSKMGEIDADLLAEKFDSASIDENGNASVSITEDETNQALQLALQASGTDVINNAYIAYTGGTIVFTGDIDAGALRAVIRPYVSNGELNYEIVEATVNGMQIPPATYAAIEETINSTLAQVMGELPDNVTLTGISVGEGIMTATATIQ